MSIDSRLRQGLQRSMSAINADADRLLDDARRRGHRRIIVQRVAALVALAATVAIVAFAGPAVLDVLRNQGPEPATNPSPLPLAGTYTTTISAQEGAADPTAIGTWLMTLERDGTLDLASLTNGDIGRSVTQYQVSEDEFLTTALVGSECPGVGRYTWTRIGSTLTFVVVDDACALRESIFSIHPWNRT